MITVIIAGGSGTRLWPLSTSDYPKHLLKLVDDKSLLQTAFDRAKAAGDTTYVVTEAGHAAHVKDQLPELAEDNFLIEPGRRGTGNCIIFALDVIARRHDKSEPIAFVHSDHHVRDTEGYVRTIQTAAEASAKSGRITLIGIEPTYPATGFGYIERDGEIDSAEDAYNIQSFKEKPDFDTAKKYMQAGNYLWNCGYFIGSVDTFMREIEKVSPELTQNFNALASTGEPMDDEYNKTYLDFDDQVIDYALSEKSTNLAVVPATFDWMDLGSFKDLHGIVDKDESGNYFYGDELYPVDVENVFVRNEETKPIAVIGLDNVVVVNTPDGILIARKDLSHRTGEVAKQIQASSKG